MKTVSVKLETCGKRHLCLQLIKRCVLRFVLLSSTDKIMNLLNLFTDSEL